MKLLILGGTRFVGRHLVEAALANGHEVTLFYRGKTNPDLFPEAEHIHGDRDSQMHLLDGRKWDACIDTCGYIPRHVRQSVGRLSDAVEQYTFISTISVYDEPVEPDADETSALKTLDDEDTEEVSGETYGGLKVLCERAAEDAMPGRVLHVRPGLIVGPFDPTDRFNYWLERVERGGEVLVPATADRRVQVIDGRDLAAWTLRMVEANNTGVYNAVGPAEALTWSAWLGMVRDVTGSDAQFTWVSDAFMAASGAALPFFVPEPSSSMLALSSAKATAEGLTHRPLETIIRDTLAWNAARSADEPRRVGMSAQQEKDLLQKWSQQTTT